MYHLQEWAFKVKTLEGFSDGHLLMKTMLMNDSNPSEAQMLIYRLICEQTHCKVIKTQRTGVCFIDSWPIL